MRKSGFAKGPPSMFGGGKGNGKGQFDSPEAIAMDGKGTVFIADTGNGRIEKYSPTGAFLSIIKLEGNNQGHKLSQMEIAIDHAGNIYVAETGFKAASANSHLTGLSSQSGKGRLGLYGPRRIAIGR